MKKAVCTVLLLLAVLIGASSPAWALPSLVYVEQSYDYKDTVDRWFGTHETDGKGNLLAGEALMDGGLWSYEYFDTATETFHPMTAYFAEKQEGWAHGSWHKFYTATVASAWEDGPLNYCSVGANGARLYPGEGAGAVVTFTAPASGNLSYEASLYPYGSTTSDSPDGGMTLALYHNDTRIWPQTEEDYCFWADTASSDNPAEASVYEMDVEAGDRIRLVYSCRPGTSNTFKGANFVTYPVVSYHFFKESPADPRPKLPLFYKDSDLISLSADVSSLSVTKDPTIHGMNVYIKEEKQNADLITDNEYVLSGLSPDTVYEVSVEFVSPEGLLWHHAPRMLRTKKVQKPMGLRLISQEKDAFYVAWDPVSENAAYDVYVNGALYLEDYRGSAERVSISCEEGKEYAVTVVHASEEGDSDPSKVLAVSVPISSVEGDSSQATDSPDATADSAAEIPTLVWVLGGGGVALVLLALLLFLRGKKA